MLSGKKFPQNVRALTLLAEELLRPVLKGHSVGSMTELQAVLLIISTKSRTAKLWIDFVITPVFLIMLYLRAESSLVSMGITF